MHTALVLALLLSADVPSPPDARTVRAVWLADLTPERVTSGPPGRFVFVPDSLVDEHDGSRRLVLPPVRLARAGHQVVGLDLDPTVVRETLDRVRHEAQATAVGTASVQDLLS